MNELRSRRRTLVSVNYACLLVLNVCFYFAYHVRDLTHWVDALGLLALALVSATFVPVHWRSGLWKLTHTAADRLDERELQLTHVALGRAYGGFAVISLTLLMGHAVITRLVPGIDFVITVPLAASLIYLAHTLPGTVLAWTQSQAPAEAS